MEITLESLFQKNEELEKRIEQLEGLIKNKVEQGNAKPSFMFTHFEKMELLEDKVCTYFKVDKLDITSGSRVRDIVIPRSVFVYCLFTYTKISFNSIAKKLKFKQHSTIYNCIKKCENEYDLKKDCDVFVRHYVKCDDTVYFKQYRKLVVKNGKVRTLIVE